MGWPRQPSLAEVEAFKLNRLATMRAAYWRLFAALDTATAFPLGAGIRSVTLPNKRLKLPGAHKYGRIALPRRPAFLSAAPPPCASQRCARSLSAIR